MELKKKIEDILNAQVMPMVALHGGAVRLADYEDGTVFVEMLGACADCAIADQSTRVFIEDTLRAELPDEVQRVELYQGVDQELMEFAEKLMRHEA